MSKHPKTESGRDKEEEEALREGEAWLEGFKAHLAAADAAPANVATLVMLKLARTGSTYFSSLLNSHPNVLFKPEALNQYHNLSFGEQVESMNKILTSRDTLVNLSLIHI